MWPLEGETGPQQEDPGTGPPSEDLETGPPPENLENSEDGLPVRIQWMTSRTLYPQAGKGT